MTEQLLRKLKTTEKDINGIIEVLPQIEHKRSLLDELDTLKSNRLELEMKLIEEKQMTPENMVDLSDTAIKRFPGDYKTDLKTGDPEKKKAVIRSLVESGEFNGTQLLLQIRLQQITGVKLASPRGSGTQARNRHLRKK